MSHTLFSHFPFIFNKRRVSFSPWPLRSHSVWWALNYMIRLFVDCSFSVLFFSFFFFFVIRMRVFISFCVYALNRCRCHHRRRRRCRLVASSNKMHNSIFPIYILIFISILSTQGANVFCWPLSPLDSHRLIVLYSSSETVFFQICIQNLLKAPIIRFFSSCLICFFPHKMCDFPVPFLFWVMLCTG